METLKSCPFCGEDEAEICEDRENTNDKDYVRCCNCGSRGETWMTKEKAAEAWNTRTESGVVKKSVHLENAVSEVDCLLVSVRNCLAEFRKGRRYFKEGEVRFRFDAIEGVLIMVNNDIEEMKVNWESELRQSNENRKG